MLAADHSPLETTIAYEQVAIEVTARLARRAPHGRSRVLLELKRR